MEQKTADWDEWRRRGIGSSDAPVIVGVSPWATPYQLWEQKTGRRAPNPGNWATRRGNALEPVARADYELRMGCDAPPALLEHAEYPWLRASLDGWRPKERITVEFKWSGAEDFANARNGVVPAKYFPQVQHQILVAGVTEAHYFAMTETHETALVVVPPDREYLKLLFAAECAFWKRVIDDDPPPLGDRDFKLIRDRDLLLKFEDRAEVMARIAHLQARVDQLTAEIYEAVGEGRARCGKFRVNVISRKGSVDYKRVPELRGVDLEPYRGKGSTYRTISEAKDD